jgi:hypothetical protein
MNIDQMCSDAKSRIYMHINRSEGQHLRHMREQRPCRMTDQQRVLSDELYCMAMRLTDMRVKNVDALIEGFCELAGVSYPPQQMEAVCQSQL